MSFQIVQKDITTMKVDAIVNAANSRLQMGAAYVGRFSERPVRKSCRKYVSELGIAPLEKWLLRMDFNCRQKTSFIR